MAKDPYSATLKGLKERGILDDILMDGQPQTQQSRGRERDGGEVVGGRERRIRSIAKPDKPSRPLDLSVGSGRPRSGDWDSGPEDAWGGQQLGEGPTRGSSSSSSSATGNLDK